MGWHCQIVSVALPANLYLTEVAVLWFSKWHLGGQVWLFPKWNFFSPQLMIDKSCLFHPFLHFCRYFDPIFITEPLFCGIILQEQVGWGCRMWLRSLCCAPPCSPLPHDGNWELRLGVLLFQFLIADWWVTVEGTKMNRHSWKRIGPLTLENKWRGRTPPQNSLQ